MVLIVITTILNAVSSIVFLLGLILLIECIASLFPPQSSSKTDLWQSTSIAILMPAHNEEMVIAQTLKTIIPQLKSSDRLIVIADNCDDNTATIAEEMGAIVKVRKDLEKRGKGYALDYGLQYLAKDSPDIVIFVDADSIVHDNTISILTENAISCDRPIQALYLMETPSEPTTKDYISAFAFKVKNLVRPLGLNNLNKPCLLTGTGMAIPWQIINTVNLASGNIVEDMKLGLDLAIAGYPPQFAGNAKVIGCLPQKQQATTTQRTRWEHGHLQTAITYVPLLLQASVKQTRLDLLVMALDLAIPPLSLFVLFWLTSALLSLVIMILTGMTTPFILAVVNGLIIISGILIAWWKFGQDDLPLITLIKVPIYILWKIPLYFKFLGQKESHWIRTDRDNK